MAVDGKWFRDQLKTQGKSQRGLARFMKVEPAIITRMFDNKRKMQLDDCKQIARFLSLPVDDVLAHAGIEIRQKTKSGKMIVPIAGQSDRNCQVFMSGGDLSVTTEINIPSDAVAIRMQHPEGWTAFIQQDPQSPEIMIMRMVVAHCPDNSYWIGELRRGFEPGHFNLFPVMGESIEDLEVDHCLPIVWIRPT